MPRHEQRRRTGKLTVTRALDEDAGERMRSLASVRRARERERQRMHQEEQIKIVRDVTIPETLVPCPCSSVAAPVPLWEVCPFGQQPDPFALTQKHCCATTSSARSA